VISPPDWGLAPSAFLRKRKVCVGVYKLLPGKHLLGVEFPSAGLDAGGSEEPLNSETMQGIRAYLQPGRGGLFHLSASVVKQNVSPLRSHCLNRR